MSRSITGSSGTRPRSRIDVSQEQECRFWAERLGVYPRQLKEAVRVVGNSVDDLWRYIDERKHEPPGVCQAYSEQTPVLDEHDEN